MLLVCETPGRVDRELARAEACVPCIFADVPGGHIRAVEELLFLIISTTRMEARIHRTLA